MAKIGKWTARFAAFFLFFSCYGLARAGTVTGELDKAVGSIEDQFVYTLSVQGSMDGEPEFPKIEGLDVQRTGTSQSVSIINGKFSREVQYQYVLVPQKAGTFQIPPLRVKLDGAWQETLALDLKVEDVASSGPGAAGGGGGNDAQGSAEQPVFIERRFTRSKVYVGEPLVATVAIFHRVKFFGAEPEITYPDTFQVKNIDDQKNFTRTIDGQEYAVTELNSILTPGKEGKYTIDPAILNAKIGGAPRRRSRSWLDDWMTPTEVVSKRFRSPPAEIEVVALPLEGRRADFTGLVGRNIEIKSEVSKREIKVGETVTVTLTLTSDGATAGMADPELKLGDKAKIYRDKPQSLDQLDLSRGVAGQRVLKYAVVPAKSGKLNLGKLSLQVFDADSGQYKDILTELGEVEVEGNAQAPADTQALAAQEPPAAAKEEARSQAKEVETLGEDLVEPHAPSRLESSALPSPLEWGTGGLLSLGGLILLTSTLWREKRQDGREERELLRQRKEALSRYLKAMQGAQEQLRQAQSKAAALQAHNALKAYFSSKFGLRSSSLTLGDALVCLEERKIAAASQDSIRALWLGLDRVLYAPDVPSNQTLETFLQNAQQLMQEVDKQC